MRRIRYIYFEIKWTQGPQDQALNEKIIENENILLIKPNTNSNGIWGYTNVTEHKMFSGSAWNIVDQRWIDLEKFSKIKTNVYDREKEYVNIALERLNKKLHRRNKRIKIKIYENSN